MTRQFTLLPLLKALGLCGKERGQRQTVVTHSNNTMKLSRRAGENNV